MLGVSFRKYSLFRLDSLGDAATALSAQEGISIKNKGVDTKMKAFGGGYKARYVATGGFWPIPQSQIQLSEGVLTQNKGWGTAEAKFPRW